VTKRRSEGACWRSVENVSTDLIDGDLVLIHHAIAIDGSAGQCGVTLRECPDAGTNEGLDPAAHHEELYAQAPKIVFVPPSTCTR